MSIDSNVDLATLATGLSFDVSINVPDFREVQFLFVQQDDWWLVSIDQRPAFSIATFTVYNLFDFIDSDLDFTFQLLPKNLLNQELTADNIGDFYLKLNSGDGFDDAPEMVVDPDFIYSDELLPFDDFLLDPLPSGAPPFAYLTSSNFDHDNLDILGWENLIGDKWDDAQNTAIAINSDFNVNSFNADSTAILKRTSNIDQDIESGPTTYIIFKPSFAADAVKYNLIQLGTDNDVYVSLEKNGANIEYEIKRNSITTQVASYSASQVLGVAVELNKGTVQTQSIRTSTGEVTEVTDDTVTDVGGGWGFFTSGGRDLLDMEVIEALVLPPNQSTSEKNRIMSYLNKKYNLSFTQIT